MLRSNYKRLSYVGITLWTAILICQAALLTDDSGIHIEFGIIPNLALAVLFILILVFFLLPLFYVKSYSRKLFISILVTGAVAIFLPAMNAWETIRRWLTPKENTFLSGLHLFHISEFRSAINNIENIVLLGLFFCQLVLFILTFIVKKSRPSREDGNKD